MINHKELIALENQLEGMFKWITEDYGMDVLPSVAAQLMIITRQEPELDLVDCAYNVALDWSK